MFYFRNDNPSQLKIHYVSKSNPQQLHTCSGTSAFPPAGKCVVVGFCFHHHNKTFPAELIHSLVKRDIGIIYICDELPRGYVVNEHIVYVETQFRWFTHLLFKEVSSIKGVFYNNSDGRTYAELLARDSRFTVPVLNDIGNLSALDSIKGKVEEYSKDVLIETFDGLGDVLMSLPSAQTLHKQGYRVSYVTYPHFKDIFKGLEFVHNVYSSKDVIDSGKVSKYIELTNKLSMYDQPFNQQHRIFSSAFFCDLNPDQLVTQKPTLCLTLKEKQWAQQLVKGYRHTVGIIWNANNDHRTYPRENVASLVKLLKNRGYTPFILGTEKDTFDFAINMGGKTSLRQLFALINALNYIVTVDTGVLHVAGAFDKKTVALMGPMPSDWRCSTYKNCYPLEPDKKLIPCSPCCNKQWGSLNKRKCSDLPNACMKSIQPSRIVDKLDEIKDADCIGEDPLFLEGYAGIGDNFWQRPFIKEVCKSRVLYLTTYTPQVYWDIPNLRPVRPPWKSFKHHNRLADQLDTNVWYDRPIRVTTIQKPDYWVGFRQGLTMMDQFKHAIPIDNYDLSFPVKEEWMVRAKRLCKKIGAYKTKKKVCIVHFPTHRQEWRCPSRDPKPEYLQLLVDKYSKDYFFISVADLTFERFEQPPRNIDHCFHYGELSMEDLFGLVKIADLVITPNCYLLPMSVAIGTKTFGVYGGCQKPELFLDVTNIPHYGQVTPEPFCNCLNPEHHCFKDIPTNKIFNNIEELIHRTTPRKNLLIYRVGHRYHSAFENNKTLNEKYNLIFQVAPVDDIEALIVKTKAKAVISVDYPPERTKEICRRLGVNWIFNEAFLGIRNVFDRTGAHFDPDNDIKKHIDAVKVKSTINIPSWTKVEQPPKITKQDLFKKYNLEPKDKYIVLLGQEVCDKSIIHSKNPDIKSYNDYIYHLVMNNLDTKFLFKAHPVYNTIKRRDAHLIQHFYNYKNIVPIDENIQSLFDIFNLFTAYSSTTILEGLTKDRKFATVGYHFCDHDDLVFQMRSIDDFKNLHAKLSNFHINKQTKQKYLHFIYNYYSIPCDSKQLVDRLEMSSEEYFNQNY